MAFKINNNSDDEEIMADINMTPLIDIMLVLLIIFMVTSSLSLESGLDIDIPKTSSKTQTQEGESIIVSLDTSGKVSIQGTPLEIKDDFKNSFMNRLKAVINENKTASIIFEGDQGSTLGKMIEIMDMAKEAGAKKFSIAAESAI